MCVVELNAGKSKGIEDLTVTRSISPNAHTEEEMVSILQNRIRRAEAGGERIISNKEVFDSIGEKYGLGD